MVGRDDISDMTKGFVEENRLLKKSRKMLISNYFAEKTLFTTPLVKWYLKQGLGIRKIYEFAEYAPDKTFENFSLDMTDARRMGNCDSSKTILANISKLIGTSAYSCFFLKGINFGESPSTINQLLIKQ